jgi:transposase, IS30 family
MKHLSKHERNEIQILKWKWYSLRDIATVLERNVSTISRELKRNKINGTYSAKKADLKSYQRWHRRKIQMKKIRCNDELENYIREKLILKRTPQLIAGAWNKSHTNNTVGYVTIYKYIYSRFGSWLWEYLYSKRHKPRKRRHNTIKKQLIPNRVWIDVRPISISKLLEFWHYEADLIVGSKWTKAVLLTLTEKVSRLKLAYRLPNKSPLTVQKKLQSIIERFGIKSITFDNWIEFMYHYKLGIATYFCHPYHSREKGQVEYTNKLYRIFIKKWTDLSNYTQENIDLFTSNLNNRPMVCLDYETPSKIFHSFLPSVAFAPIM